MVGKRLYSVYNLGSGTLFKYTSIEELPERDRK